MPIYAEPELNPRCRCSTNPLAAFFCPHGHLTECHYPFDCRLAGCGHLWNYEFSREEAGHAHANAISLLSHMATFGCPECGGAGRVKVISRLGNPVNVICSCVVTAAEEALDRMVE